MAMRTQAYAPLPVGTQHSRALSSLERLDRTLDYELARNRRSHAARPSTDSRSFNLPSASSHSHSHTLSPSHRHRGLVSRPPPTHSYQLPLAPPRPPPSHSVKLAQLATLITGVVAAALSVAGGASIVSITLNGHDKAQVGTDPRTRYMALCAGISSLAAGAILGLMDIAGWAGAGYFHAGNNPGAWVLASGVTYAALSPNMISGPISQPAHPWLSGIGISLATAGALRLVVSGVYAFLCARNEAASSTYAAWHTRARHVSWEEDKHEQVDLYSTEGHAAPASDASLSSAPYTPPVSPPALLVPNHSQDSGRAGIGAHAAQTGLEEPEQHTAAFHLHDRAPRSSQRSTQSLLGPLAGGPVLWGAYPLLDNDPYSSAIPERQSLLAPGAAGAAGATTATADAAPSTAGATTASASQYASPLQSTTTTGGATADLSSAPSGEAHLVANPGVQGQAQLVDQCIHDDGANMSSQVASVHRHITVEGLGELTLSSDSESESEYSQAPVSAPDARLSNAAAELAAVQALKLPAPDVRSERRGGASRRSSQRIATAERRQRKEARAIRRGLSQHTQRSTLLSLESQPHAAMLHAATFGAEVAAHSANTSDVRTGLQPASSSSRERLHAAHARQAHAGVSNEAA